jgi:predicted DNA-binding protein with PD1-like motif
MEQGILVRLDPGDEIVDSLTRICQAEDVHLACVNGLGAANDVTIGIFSPGVKKYATVDYRDDYEISALTGNVTRKDGEVYLHLHITIGNPTKDEVHAGHLSRAVISATSEIFLQVWSGEVGRKFSDKIGLNLFEF